MIRNGFRNMQESARAVLKICPPPSPWLPSISIMPFVAVRSACPVPSENVPVRPPVSFADGVHEQLVGVVVVVARGSGRIEEKEAGVAPSKRVEQVEGQRTAPGGAAE